LPDWVMTHDPFVAFPLAGEAFVSLLDTDRLQSRWNEPSALASYSIGELVAHVALAMERAHGFLTTQSSPDMEPVGLGGYYGELKIEASDEEGSFVHAILKSLAETEAARPCADVVAKATHIIAEITLILADAEPSRILDLQPLPQGAMATGDYVATRVVELVIHGMDLAASLDESFALPPPAADVVIELLVTTARFQHGDLAVLCALARSERAVESVFPVL
jgi:uncharacterized protein (TIGR03083 family)